MTGLELRRLALRATRNPEWRPILQDALLEHYGKEFEREIANAHRRAASTVRGSFVAVVYHPVRIRLSPRNSRRSTWVRSSRPSVFDIMYFEKEDLDYTWPDSWVRILARSGRVPVYLVPTGRRR